MAMAGTRGQARAAGVAGLLAVLTGALILSPSAFAHSSGESFLHLDPEATGASGRGRWEIALRDLDDLLSLDADGDGTITRGELHGRRSDVTQLALAHLTISNSAGSCATRSDELTTTRRSGVTYALLSLALHCPPARGAADFLDVDYRLLLDQDRLHRGIIQVVGPAQATVIVRAGASQHRFPLSAVAASAGPGAFLRFVREGLVHIGVGLDHLLFLLVLLLPAVLRRQDGRWVAATDLRAVLGQVLKVVTAFTVAHSLTLSLAALGILQASPSVIEPAIAASVLLAAAANLWPPLASRLGGERWAVAFGLGLLHGFGFSSVLAELDLPRGSLLSALLGFNLGVELGQIALVLLFVPVAFALRHTGGYRRLGLQAGSALTALVAAWWLVERTL